MCLQFFESEELAVRLVGWVAADSWKTGRQDEVGEARLLRCSNHPGGGMSVT